MSYGPTPWQQTNWDWRAAANFIAGGAGSGLVVVAALAGAPAVAMLCGLALIAIGLGCVWLEIGRPLRAINVLFNPRTSWMSREALVATLLLPVGLAAAWFWPALGSLAAALAFAFVYCQARLVNAARGIPAWREPLLVPLIVATGLGEGAGLWLIALPGHAAAQPAWVAAFGALLLVRAALWSGYRKRLSPQAREAFGGAAAQGWLLVAGTLAPLALLVLAAGGATLPRPLLLGAAGLLAAGAGAWFKARLITRAGFNQGFALARLPVRGVPRR